MAQQPPSSNVDGHSHAGPHALSLGRLALDVLLPPQCLACSAVVHEPGALCAACWERMTFLGAPQCACCGVPFAFDGGGIGDAEVLCGACTGQHPAFARARAVLAYTEASKSLVLALKHADRTDFGPAFARWMARSGEALLADADMIVPVPLHWTRLFRRRYNQAALLALALGRLTGCPVESRLLIRRKRTPSQGRMSPSERRRNVRGAFAVRAGRRAALAGKRVLLVDDVLTTGATAEACARVLLRAGADAVDVLTLARVVRTA